MNITAPLKVTKAEFYQAQGEGRFEWERGRIVQQMTGGAFDHAQIVGRDEVIAVAALGITVPLAEVYRGIGQD